MFSASVIPNDGSVTFDVTDVDSGLAATVSGLAFVVDNIWNDAIPHLDNAGLKVKATLSGAIGAVDRFFPKSWNMQKRFNDWYDKKTKFDEISASSLMFSQIANVVESEVEDIAIISGIDPGEASNLASHVENEVGSILLSINSTPGGTSDNTPVSESTTYTWNITNTITLGPLTILLGLETNQNDALNQINNLGLSGFNFNSITNTSAILIQHTGANWNGSISLQYRGLTSQGSGAEGSININFQLGF